MLPAQDLGVKVTVSLGGYRLDVGLSTDFDMLIVEQSDVFRNKRIIQRIQVKSGKLGLVVRRGERRWCRHRSRPLTALTKTSGQKAQTNCYYVTRQHVTQAERPPTGNSVAVTSPWLKVLSPVLTILSRDFQRGSGHATSASVVIQSLASVALCFAASRGRIAPVKDTFSAARQ
jgi:hypothetical protein